MIDFVALFYRTFSSCFDPRKNIIKFVRVPMKHPLYIMCVYYICEEFVLFSRGLEEEIVRRLSYGKAMK